jgi:hypothetical protein
MCWIKIAESQSAELAQFSYRCQATGKKVDEQMTKDEHD